MKNVEYLQFNAYADSNDGKRHYRAVSTSEGWKLALETKSGKEWTYITKKVFCSAFDALQAITD